MKYALLVAAIGAVFLCLSQANKIIDLVDDHTNDMCYTSLDPEYIPPDKVTAKKIEKIFLEYIPPSKRSRLPAAPRRPLDVILVVDSSRSLRKRDYHRGLRALEWLINRGRSDTMYAAVVYSYGASVAFPFLPKGIAKRLLRHIPFEAGRTNTQLALAKTMFELLQSNTSGVRENSRKKVIILSDGQSNVEPEKTLYNAFKLKMLGVEVFVIAVGKKLPGLPELMSLASTTNGHMYRVKTMSGLMKIVRMIPRPERVQHLDMKWYRKLLMSREKELAAKRQKELAAKRDNDKELGAMSTGGKH